MVLSPTALQKVNEATQMGRGAAASAVGQTYNVFRLSGSSNIAIVAGTPVMTGFRMYVDRAKKAQIENMPFDMLVEVGACDNRLLEFGDVLVETGYEERPGNQFVYAQFRPPHDSIFVRVEANCSIQRPSPDGGQVAQQPSSGWVAATGYGGITPFNREILTLQNGDYVFVDPGSDVPQAAVPVGIQQRSRTRDRRSPDLPTNIAESEFYGYVPDLPGIELTELDVIKSAHADNYEIRSIYTSDEAGLQGYVLLLRKLAS